MPAKTTVTGCTVKKMWRIFSKIEFSQSLITNKGISKWYLNNQNLKQDHSTLSHLIQWPGRTGCSIGQDELKINCWGNGYYLSNII